MSENLRGCLKRVFIAESHHAGCGLEFKMCEIQRKSCITTQDFDFPNSFLDCTSHAFKNAICFLITLEEFAINHSVLLTVIINPLDMV